MIQKIRISLYAFAFLITSMIPFSCDFKKQPPEKIRALAQEVEHRKIKQVTSIQLLDEMKSISKSILMNVNANNIDSLEKIHQCSIQKVLLTDTIFSDEISNQLREAYAYSISLGQDLQSTSQFSPKEDFLIYTQPFEIEQSDSLPKGFWYIKCSKKEIILKL